MLAAHNDDCDVPYKTMERRITIACPITEIWQDLATIVPRTTKVMQM